MKNSISTRRIPNDGFCIKRVDRDQCFPAEKRNLLSLEEEIKMTRISKKWATAITAVSGLIFGGVMALNSDSRIYVRDVAICAAFGGFAYGVVNKFVYSLLCHNPTERQSIPETVTVYVPDPNRPSRTSDYRNGC